MECPVCLEDGKRMMELTCKHQLCEECLRSCIRCSISDRKSTFECPLCRRCVIMIVHAEEEIAHQDTTVRQAYLIMLLIFLLFIAIVCKLLGLF
jgi:hypothetical protein